MANYSAVNPSLANSAQSAREYATVDNLLVLRDINDGAETATVNETGVALAVEKLGDSKVVINHSGTSGTVDGSNYFTVRIEVADNTGFTNLTSVRSIDLPAAADVYYVELSGAMLESIRTAGEDESIYIRSGVTKTGTTATDVTYGAFVTSNC